MDEKPALKHSNITAAILKAFFDIFNDLSGFPEFVLRRALATVLRDQHLTVEEEAWLPVWYRGRRIARFRADLIVGGCVIVEVKTRSEIDPLNKTTTAPLSQGDRSRSGVAAEFREDVPNSAESFCQIRGDRRSAGSASRLGTA